MFVPSLFLPLIGNFWVQACPKLAIAVWNSNSLIDDNFSIKLNGTELGTINNSFNSCTGRLFCDDTSLKTIEGACSDTDGFFQPTLEIGSALVEGSNTLRIESILDNNNGNAGNVKVGRVNVATGKLCCGNWLLNTTYNFFDGVGNGQDYNFTWTP